TAMLLCRRMRMATRGCTSSAASSEAQVLRVPCTVIRGTLAAAMHRSKLRVSVSPPCENFLYGFQGGPPGRSHRRHGAHASAPAAAPATAAPTPVGWRERTRNPRTAIDQKSQGPCGGFDKGTLAMAHIGPMRAGQKPARSPSQLTGHPPLSNPPQACPPSPVLADP